MSFPSLNDRDALLENAPVRVTTSGLAGQVQAAADAAAAAQVDADAALLKLTDIESDGKLTPGEKPAAVAARDAIIAEQGGIETQAGALGVTTEKTDYTAAITALTTYLATAPLTGWNAIPGTAVTITGTEFRDKFKAVYTARQTLLNAMVAASAARAVWANISGTGKPEDGATVGAPAGTFVNGVAVANITAAVTNFNAGNDRNSAALTNPTTAADGTAVDHTIRKDGAADISFEWAWAGAEGDIDGFLVHVYQSTSSFDYVFGSTPALETVYTVPANKRAFILFGAAADLYTSFAVMAYRSVDKDVNSTGVIKSVLVKPGAAAEKPYRPATSVAFTGDITGTINGTAAATLVSNAAAGKAASDAIAVIGDDAVLSKDEKPEVKRAWSAIDAEAPGLLNQAAALGVPAAAYTAAFDALSTYLGTVAYDTYTTDTTIVRSTFITKFTDYYTAKTALQNALTVAAARADFSYYERWEFRGSLEGWVNVSGITSMTATADSIVVDSAGTDPIIRSPGLSFSGAQSPIVRARIKRTAGAVGSWDGNLYFTSVAQPGEGGGGSVAIPDPTILNQWVVAEWNMSSLPGWTGNTITSFRPDMGKAAADTFEIDWIGLGKYGPSVSGSELTTMQAAIDAAVAEQTAIASDNVLSKGEKSFVIREWDAIAGEKDNLINKATTLDVSSATYSARVTDLSNYLIGLSPLWYDANQDTPIVGLTFRTRFIDVYTAKTALVAEMNSKAATAPNLNAGIARNLLSNSAPGSLAGWGLGYQSVAFNAAVFTPPGHTFDVYGPNKTSIMVNRAGATGAGSTCDLSTGPLFRILPSRRYEFSVALSMHRATGFARFVFYDANRNQLSPFYDGNSVAATQATSATNPFPRSLGFATAPANAAFAVLLCTMVADGGNDPYMFASQAYVGEALPAQTVGTLWAEGAPADVRAIGYSGDLNATSGAPAGSLIAGVDATTVKDQAAAAIPGGTAPVLSITGGGLTGSGPTGSRAFGSRSVAVSGNYKTPLTYQWSIASSESDAGQAYDMYLTGGTTSSSVGVSGRMGVNGVIYGTVMCLVTDANGISRSAEFGIHQTFGGGLQ